MPLIAVRAGTAASTSTSTSTSTGAPSTSTGPPASTSTAGPAPFWTQRFRELKYTFNILPDADKVPCALVMNATGVEADSWTARYRLAGAQMMWSNPSALMWSTDESLPFWSAPEQVTLGWLPWPGRIEGCTRQVYEWQLQASPGPIQGKFPQVEVLIDVPDIREHLTVTWIDSTGTRLPITQSYRAIKLTKPTILAFACSTARSAIVVDNGLGGPPLTAGPLVQLYSAAGVATSGAVSWEVIGY